MKQQTEFYIVRHIPTDKYLKFEEEYPDGFGFYRPSVRNCDLNFSDDFYIPSRFETPKLPEYHGVKEEGPLWRSARDIPASELEFVKVTLTFETVKA
jgi:hypothetical protein